MIILTGSCYIAGPMRGRPYYNFPAFDAARSRLTEIGWRVISPADLDRAIGFDPWTMRADTDWNQVPNFDMNAAFERDVAALRSVDAIALLPEWERSIGARAEAGIAQWLGKTRICPKTGKSLPWPT